MTFEEVLPYLKKGEKVYRTCWPKAEYLWLNFSQTLQRDNVKNISYADFMDILDVDQLVIPAKICKSYQQKHPVTQIVETIIMTSGFALSAEELLAEDWDILT